MNVASNVFGPMGALNDSDYEMEVPWYLDFGNNGSIHVMHVSMPAVLALGPVQDGSFQELVRGISAPLPLVDGLRIPAFKLFDVFDPVLVTCFRFRVKLRSLISLAKRSPGFRLVLVSTCHVDIRAAAGIPSDRVNFGLALVSGLYTDRLPKVGATH